MKKTFLPLAVIIAFSACNRTPRTEIIDNNPRLCWSCTQYIRTSVTGLDYKYVVEKDTVICEKTGIEMADIMAKRDTGRITISNYTMLNVNSIEECSVR